MYEINPRLFGERNAFRNIIPRLDAIRDLSVNVIWIMPIHPIGQVNSVNSPYSIQDFTKVNPEFGTLEDFRALVEAAHERGMAVIMDWVANHTAWDNPWIENRNWYTQDANGNIISPAGTNWRDVADLNFSNMNMRRAMIDAMKYWIVNANIDGFRADAADFVPFDFWQQAIRELNAIPDRNLIWLAEGTRPNHITAGFEMIFGFDFYAQLKYVYQDGRAASILMDADFRERATLGEGNSVLRYTTNHDESAWDATPVVVFGGQDGALSAFTIVVSSGGVPLIYSSQEVGVVGNVPFFSTHTIRWDQNPTVTAMYETILQFYSNSNAMRRGSLVWHGNNDVWSVIRTYQNENVLVLVNVRNSISSVDLPEAFRNRQITDVLTGVVFDLSTSIELNNYQFLIFKI